MKVRMVVLGCLLTLTPLVASAQAQSRSDAGPLQVRAENVTARDGGRPGREALPGDIVRFELAFTNPTQAPVRNVVFDNPIPSGMRFEAGTARADVGAVTVTYSIDGGRAYSAQPMIEQVVNGERRIVAAPLEMYTHVRWTVGSSVRPGAQVTAEFRARVADRTPSTVY